MNTTTILEALEARMNLAKYAKDILPNRARCLCCRLPTGIVEMKLTRYGAGMDQWMAPLCTLCWKAQTPESRLKFYSQQYKADHPNGLDWVTLESIVRSGG